MALPPTRTSEAPPPMPSVPWPMPPGLTAWLPCPPTKIDSDAPGVTARVPLTRPPRPPVPPGEFGLPPMVPAPLRPLPPWAPLAKILADVTPAGTTVVCSPPVKPKAAGVSPTAQLCAFAAPATRSVGSRTKAASQRREIKWWAEGARVRVAWLRWFMTSPGRDALASRI